MAQSHSMDIPSYQWAHRDGSLRTPVALVRLPLQIPFWMPGAWSKMATQFSSHRACFLTSTLVATLALSLIIPMTMIADIFVKDVGIWQSLTVWFALSFDGAFLLQASYNWMFYTGICPVFFAFFAVTLLSHYDNWDPVWLIIKKFLHFVCRRRLIPRFVLSLTLPFQIQCHS